MRNLPKGKIMLSGLVLYFGSTYICLVSTAQFVLLWDEDVRILTAIHLESR